MSEQTNEQTLRCFSTAPFECSYLPAREARNLIIDPAVPLTSPLLGDLLNVGFRRSGQHLYRPNCEQCQACIAVRLEVCHFQPNRSQRRNWHQNSSLTHQVNVNYSDEQFGLYRQYVNARHGEGTMANPTIEQYVSFLTADGIDTRFHEFRLDDRLVAVAVTDHTPLGLSAVYTFYHPELQRRALGTYAVLWQIQHAQQLELPWVYLGYWIKECDKMSYKNHFQPSQGYQQNRWRDLTR